MYCYVLCTVGWAKWSIPFSLGPFIVLVTLQVREFVFLYLSRFQIKTRATDKKKKSDLQGAQRKNINGNDV